MKTTFFFKSVYNYKTEREPVLRRLRETPLGCCLRIIVNEFHPNLENTCTVPLLSLKGVFAKNERECSRKIFDGDCY